LKGNGRGVGGVLFAVIKNAVSLVKFFGRDIIRVRERLRRDRYARPERVLGIRTYYLPLQSSSTSRATRNLRRRTSKSGRFSFVFSRNIPQNERGFLSLGSSATIYHLLSSSDTDAKEDISQAFLEDAGASTLIITGFAGVCQRL